MRLHGHQASVSQVVFPRFDPEAYENNSLLLSTGNDSAIVLWSLPPKTLKCLPKETQQALAVNKNDVLKDSSLGTHIISTTYLHSLLFSSLLFSCMYVCVHVCMYVYICIWVCMYVHVCVCMCMCVYGVCMCIYACVCVCMCMYVYVCVYE